MFNVSFALNGKEFTYQLREENLKKRNEAIDTAHLSATKYAMAFAIVSTAAFLGTSIGSPYFASDGTFVLFGRQFTNQPGTFAGVCFAYVFVSSFTAVCLRQLSVWTKLPVRTDNKTYDVMFEFSFSVGLAFACAMFVSGFASNAWFVFSSLLGVALAGVAWSFGYAVPKLENVAVVTYVPTNTSKHTP